MHCASIKKDSGEHSGRVHIELYGFKEQSVVSINNVVDAVEALPNHHLVDLKEIRFDPKRIIQSVISRLFNRPHINRFDAEYIDKINTIVLYRITQKSLFLHVLYHEIGHHVYYHVINSTIRRQWVKQVRPNCQYFISPYAARNASEDFAETYAAYMMNPERLKQITEKYQFMKKYVYKLYSTTSQNMLDIRL